MIRLAFKKSLYIVSRWTLRCPHQSPSKPLVNCLGFCCITYKICPEEPNSFSLSSRPFSSGDNACIEDYIIIEGSSNSCMEKFNLSHRYCERVLNAVKMQTNNVGICGTIMKKVTLVCHVFLKEFLFLDCTPPFMVSIITNEGQSTMISPVQDRGRSKYKYLSIFKLIDKNILGAISGLCLDYVQLLC